jgi:hypothetical protein
MQAWIRILIQSPRMQQKDEEKQRDEALLPTGLIYHWLRALP